MMEERSLVELQDEDFVKSLKELLVENPLLTKLVLQVVAEAQTSYVNKLERRRSCEASNAILDLIASIMDPEQFKKFPLKRQKELMKRVIAYHFPDGCDKGYSQCEREFYKKFGSVEKKAKE
jgi:hypothetical protein